MPRHLTVVPVLLLTACLAPLAAQEAVDQFGMARARALAELGRLPSGRDVAVRDIVNYRRHLLPRPGAGEDVALAARAELVPSPTGDELWLAIGYATAPQGDRALAAPCAVALVVDCSGSMAEAGKLTAVQAGLRAFVGRLRADDEVALVTFASEAQVVAGRRARGDGAWLLAAIDGLHPAGNTNLHAGLQLGLGELTAADAGRQRRVVLLTDGIANVGVVDPQQIAAATTPTTAAGIAIATIGVGEDLDTALLRRLAGETRGLCHFVAGADDVQKVFVVESDSLLAAVARDVQLAIPLADGLDVLDVYDERAELRPGRVELRLPDLNAGATGVVLLRCRADHSAQVRPLPAGATLQFVAARTGARSTVRCPPLALAGAAPPPDLELHRNAAIAVLARGLAAMAAAADDRRWSDADRALRLADDAARRLFPGQDDDVARVRELVAAHQRTLQRYVDRFRDL